MKSTKEKVNSMDVLLALKRSLAITYDDYCEEESGLNLSGVDNIPISILNLTKEEQRSITDLDREGTTFMWKTLLINCLINMNYEVYDSRDKLVEILKEKYKTDSNNLGKIDEFHQTYKKSDAIRWYKTESCVYRELNTALRRSCINMIFAYRFYLRDLSEQLQEERKNFSNTDDENIIYLYRGQRASNNELERLKNLKYGYLISADSFFSSSRSEIVAAGFMQPKPDEDVNLNLIPLRYDIECDLRLETKPFADISPPRLGPLSEEEEVLFMVGTIFKFKKIFYDDKSKFWRVKIKLINEKSHRLSNLYESFKEEIEDQPNLLTLGSLLTNAGDYEHALRIYMRSFFDLFAQHDQLTELGHQHVARSIMGIAAVKGELGEYDNSIELFNESIKYINDYIDQDYRKYYQADVYYGQSLPLSEKGDYLSALKQCKHALRIFYKYPGDNGSRIASCYEMIGNIYGELGRLERAKNNITGQYRHIQKAFHCYNNTLQVRKDIYKDTPEHPNISVTYINFGELYRDMGQTDKALQYTLTAYNTFIAAFPKSHSWIGIALDNLGEIYVQQQQFTQAEQKYNQALDVYKKTLPKDHRFIGETLHNIGKLYCSMYVFDKALHYFIQAKQIYAKKIPNKHHLAIELHGQINYVSTQLNGSIG